MNGIGEKGSGKSKREEVCRLGVGSGGKADQIKPCRSSRGCWLSLWIKWEMTDGFVQKWDVIWFELATVWRRVQVGISWGAWCADPSETWEGPGKMEKGWGPAGSWVWSEGRTIRADMRADGMCVRGRRRLRKSRVPDVYSEDFAGSGLSHGCAFLRHLWGKK